MSRVVFWWMWAGAAVVSMPVISACGLDVNGLGSDPSGGSGAAGASGTAAGATSGLAGASDATGASGTSATVGASGGFSSARDASLDADAGLDAAAGQDASPRRGDSGSPKLFDATPEGNGADSQAPAEGGACVAGAADCVVVPDGWSLVGFAPGEAGVCPAAFDPTPSSVSAGPHFDSACACGPCAITSAASCATGSLELVATVRGAGSDPVPPLPTCDAAPVGLPWVDGSCAALPAPVVGVGASFLVDIEAMPPLSTGGACQSPGQSVPGGVRFDSKGSLCTLTAPESALCDAGTCSVHVDPPYAACLAKPGETSCPPGPLSVAHVVESDVSYSCGPCDCSVAAQCSGTLTFYDDPACAPSATAATVVADGTCQRLDALIAAVSYAYAPAAPTTTCAASGSSAAVNPVLSSPLTLCCNQ